VIIDILTACIIYFAAFAWGANEPWAMGLIASATLTLLVTKLIGDAWLGRFEILGASILLPMLLFLAYVGCQLLGPISWLSFPGTVERYSTILYLLLTLSYVAVVYIIGNGMRSRDLVKWLVILIIVLGMTESVYGLIQYLGNYNYIWQYRRVAYQSMASGTLINRNHYALLMNLCICTATGYLYYRSAWLMGENGISLRRLVSLPGAAKLVWIALWIAFMGIALVFSMSRMGIVAMFCSIGAMMTASRIVTRQIRRAGAIAAMLLLAILGLALYIGADAVLVRYESLTQERGSDEDRIALWRDAWNMIKEHPVFGQGLGTFRWT
jgi:O-antigen ligase